ncbi:endonuclease 8-like 3 isoform X1 [Paramuricea clavata]|uniref:Endonuclease 8-like 3 isoform X1 n=1 Tax=Paramuricea clavata TaxID=317549 RepID=A0A7D9IJG7_PARCT|nr:endonuclease 8-like 3 isoform X1 [Paramuricea clavata]
MTPIYMCDEAFWGRSEAKSCGNEQEQEQKKAERTWTDVKGTIDKGSFWFCGQKPICGFLCTEEDSYLFQTALAAWRATGLTQPICESHRKPAKFRVVKDMLKKSYGQPYFTCQSRENPCSLWFCYHNKPCAVKQVKKQGPNTGKKFFCCCNENRCDYFEWCSEELPKQHVAMAPFVPLFYSRYYPDAQQN